ncbi:MAG: LysR family transcriptional regulator [Marinobacter sp.]|uniref:LysR family transcriptional regulator n=1 Tax=Marinobacter sp. TaxID=50741 RepID=UPI00299E78A9|nr:LysR family transcriptional regulator [Marinobacter sp.]MDX1757780.1 LysR family transcriptional regulator [Marinobacter sp.]
MNQSLNFKHLYYFWVIAREGSLVKASELLDLAPQTLSSQLTKLEETVGSLLFRRENRRLVLTDLGQTTYRYADEMFRVAEELRSVLDAAPEERPIGLAVGVSASIHKLIAFHLLEPAFTLPRPVRLRCRTGGLDDLMRELKSLQLDVVLTDRLPDQEPGSHWYAHAVGTSSISLFASPETAERLRNDFPHSLEGQAFLANSVQAPYVHRLLQWFEEQGIRLNIWAEIDDSALIKVFGRQGLGVFAAPTLVQEEVCRQYQVDAIGEVAAVTESLYAITRSRITAHPSVAAICGQELMQQKASKKTD